MKHLRISLVSSVILCFGFLAPPEVKAQISLETKVSTIFDKVPLNASKQDVASATSIQDPATGLIKLFAAKNSFASFNLLLTAKGSAAKDISVAITPLTSEGGSAIKNASAYTKETLFDFADKPVELFFVRYLEIKGLSKISYEAGYDERHVPEKFRRPSGSGGWSDRPHANKLYPDILVPLVLNDNFEIKNATTQSVIGDIFVGKDVAPGIYRGTLKITTGGKSIKEIPLELTVHPTVLNDDSPARTMVYIETADVAERYLGERYPSGPGPTSALRNIIDNHFKLARRHGITLFDKSGEGAPPNSTQPSAEWIRRLSGELFTKSRGYMGPGIGNGSDLYVIGAYGSWNGKDSPESLSASVKKWDAWFTTNFPKVELFFYVADESDAYPQLEKWCATVAAASTKIKPFITIPLPKALSLVPSAGVAASWFNFGDTQVWEDAKKEWDREGKQLVLYNGRRPLTGSFATEDDGVALRTLPWIQMKKGVKRWFFWNSTYYNNFQGGTGKTNVFQSAKTFGAAGTHDAKFGDQGWNYSNGDGVLVYPGTDKSYPEDSYGASGPLASLRLKTWRAGIEDAKYIELALAKNNRAASNIVNELVKRVVWEVGVADINDPTWNKSDISWSTDPQVWEAARAKLLDIIEK